MGSWGEYVILFWVILLFCTFSWMWQSFVSKGMSLSEGQLFNYQFLTVSDFKRRTIESWVSMTITGFFDLYEKILCFGDNRKTTRRTKRDMICYINCYYSIKWVPLSFRIIPISFSYCVKFFYFVVDFLCRLESQFQKELNVENFDIIQKEHILSLIDLCMIRIYLWPSQTFLYQSFYLYIFCTLTSSSLNSSSSTRLNRINKDALELKLLMTRQPQTPLDLQSLSVLGRHKPTSWER